MPGARGTAAGKAFTGYRARVGKAKLSKTRRSARMRVVCPASSPKGCYVRLTAKVAGRKAAKPKLVLLGRNSAQTVTVRLTKSAAKRLKRRGGKLRMTALTALSSLPQSTKTTTVKRPKKRR